MIKVATKIIACFLFAINAFLLCSFGLVEFWMSEKNFMINTFPTHFFIGFIMKHNPYQIIQ